jgi:hypothetical protein
MQLYLGVAQKYLQRDRQNSNYTEG